MLDNLHCPICAGTCTPFDVVDFNKSCQELNGKFIPMSGIPVYYYACQGCGFCFAPEFGKWELKDFEEKIYNDEYIQFDPDYKELRPQANAEFLINTFNKKAADIHHLDYGAGNGLLSEKLKQEKWNSVAYDPFIDTETNLKDLGSFNLITAFEVFEHVPDVNVLLSELKLLLTDNGIILFSTLLSDGNLKSKERMSWWYASPRNGHISLFSKNSLNALAKKYGYHFGSFNAELHIMHGEIPDWASHIIKRN